MTRCKCSEASPECRRAVYSLGISPCPNDTYIFEALINGRIEMPFAVETRMADVERLNMLARTGDLAVTKLSLAAVPFVLERYALLHTGAALGRGCGPLVVSRPGISPERLARAGIAIPGALTTANLLLSLTKKFHGPRVEMTFDQVMPAVRQGRAELGVIIHEGRFTYAAQGLSLVLDLGAWWEEATGLPLPLGVIAARRDLGREAAEAVQGAIRRSLLFARANPQAGRAFIRAHAQELEEQIMDSHILTFVNDFSLDLGEEGRTAILSLLEQAGRNKLHTLDKKSVFV